MKIDNSEDLIVLDWWGAIGGGVSPEYQVILDYLTSQGWTKPSTQQQLADNQWILDLKAIEVSPGISAWDKIDCIQVMYVEPGLENMTTVNWKNPSGTKAVNVNSSALIPYKGYKMNGTNQYWNTNFVPSTATNNTTNDAGYIIYYQDIAQSSSFDGCTSSGSIRVQFNPFNLGGSLASVFVNENATAPNINDPIFIGTPGLYFFGRTSSSNDYIRKNELSLINNSGTSTSKPSQPFYLGCLNVNGTTSGFNTRSFGLFMSGASITSNQVAISNAWFKRLSALDQSVSTKLLVQSLVQSNGFGSNNLTDDNFTDLNYLTVTPNVFISNNSTSIGAVSGFSTYESDVNGKGSLFGPDASLYKDLATAGKSFYALKWGLGSTSLNPTASNVFYWHPTDNTYPSFRLYPLMKAQLDNTIDLLYRLGKNLSRVEIIWFQDQGEGDSAGTQLAYYTGLNQFYSQIAIDYSSYFKGKIIMRRQYYPTTSATTRLAQEQFCNDDPTKRLIYNSDDLPKHDTGNIHLTIHGQEISGQRAAAAILAAGWI